MWMYLAGFVDCDGWITWSSQGQKGPIVGMTQHNSCIDGMMKIRDFLNKNKIRHTLINRNTNMINIHIKHQESLLIFLNRIKDYLLFKKDKAEKAIIWLKSRLKERKKQERIWRISGAAQEKRRYWKPDEIDKMIFLFKDKTDIAEIASILNRSYQSVWHKIDRLNLKEIRINTLPKLQFTA